MRKITSFLTLLLAGSSMVAMAQSKYYPHNKRLTPQEVKEGREFILCTAGKTDNSNFFDRSSQGTGDFISFPQLTAASKLQAEAAENDKYYIKCVATGEYLGYNGGAVTWNADKAAAKTFTIEAVGLNPASGSGTSSYPAQKTAGNYDLVNDAWGANDQELMLRIRDREGNTNRIFNCVGTSTKCEFRGGQMGWTVFVPYAPLDVTFTENGQSSSTRSLFDGYSVDDADIPAKEGYLGLLADGTNPVVDAATNTTFAYDYYRNTKVPAGNKIYYIKGQEAVRGYLYYETDRAEGHHYVWATGQSNKTPNRASNDFKWFVLEKDGKKYFYSLSAQKFIAPMAQAYSGGNFRGGCWVYTSIPAPISFEDIAGKPTYSRVSSNGVDLSLSPSYVGPVITYYAPGDGGVPITFLETTEDVTAAKAAAEALFEHLTVRFHDGGDNYYYATYYSDNHTQIPADEDIEVYIVTGKEGENQLTLQRHNNKILTAKQGFLLRKRNGNAVTLEVEYDHRAVTAITDNRLQGTVDTGVTHQGNYVLHTGSAGIGFYPLRTTAPLPPFKATLPHTLFAEGAAPGFFYWHITGIAPLAEEQSAPAVYHDLSGRRLPHRPQKGVYLVNGKKVLF